jgi:hypothetical protein
MCNCNQKRTAYTSAKSSDRSQATTGMVQVRMVQKQPLVITGDVSGRVYEFKQKNDINWVDRRDLPYMANLMGVLVFH